jgi:adenylylsulfate kinase
MVSRWDRERLNGHRSVAIWFTGLSGSGKSTLAREVERRLFELGCRVYVCDGDLVRQGLCRDLGFSPDDRSENIRRIGELTCLLVEAGVIAVTALISPYAADRQRVRRLFAPGDFIEVFCRCPLEVCERRDVKGLYKRARAGEIRDFTGISAPYEEPTAPEIILDTSQLSVKECTEKVLDHLASRGVIGQTL